MKLYKRYSGSLGILVISLGITLFVWQYTVRTICVKEETAFLQEAQEIEDVIKYRLDDYTEVLFGLRSLFAAAEEVTLPRWNAYCESLGLLSRVPGIHSLRFDARIAAAKQDSYVVTYAWPWEENNELYGFDMFSVPARRRVIERARDSGKLAVSSKITALADRDHPVGFVMYLPVYRYGASIATRDDRRAAIQGVVAARFNAYALIDAMLHRMRRMPEIDIEIFDGTELTAEHLYYNDDERIQAQDMRRIPRYQKQVTLGVYDQPWTLYFSSQPGFGLETTEIFLPPIVLGGGLLISILLTGIVFALTTSQIRATQMAAKMTKQLEQQRAISMRSDRLRSLGEMAAGIAHELNQPLVGVRGLAEHILIAQDRGWNMDARSMRQKVLTIVEQADRMAHIIEHVRIFAREAGTPELRSINVNEVIDSSTSLLHAQFSSHGLLLEQSLAPELPPVRVNPFSLEEVVLNVLLNVRDAVEERLESEPDLPSPGVMIRTYLSNEQDRRLVTIDIRDNGIGIPETIREKIFDPFFTTKGPDKGTGLGLSISKSILEEFGGTLSVTSVPSEGTIVTIRLPAEENYGTCA